MICVSRLCPCWPQKRAAAAKPRQKPVFLYIACWDVPLYGVMDAFLIYLCTVAVLQVDVDVYRRVGRVRTAPLPGYSFFFQVSSSSSSWQQKNHERGWLSRIGVISSDSTTTAVAATGAPTVTFDMGALATKMWSHCSSSSSIYNRSCCSSGSSSSSSRSGIHIATVASAVTEG